MTRPAVPVLKNLAQIPLTVAACACFSICAFLATPIAGFAVTGFALIYLEHLIADDEG